MPKTKSRSARWFDAVAAAQAKWNEINEKADELAEALADLQEVQSEYSDWLDNLPENLHSSALGEKLQAVVDLDIEGLANDPLESWGEVEQMLGEAEGMEMPQGFGRD